MANQIDPKGISRAGQNGSPPRVLVKGSGINVKTMTNLPAGTSSREGQSSSEGATKKPSKGRRNTKGNSSTLSKGKIPLNKAEGKFPRETSKKARGK